MERLLLISLWRITCNAGIGLCISFPGRGVWDTHVWCSSARRSLSWCSRTRSDPAQRSCRRLCSGRGSSSTGWLRGNQSSGYHLCHTLPPSQHFIQRTRMPWTLTLIRKASQRPPIRGNPWATREQLLKAQEFASCPLPAITPLRRGDHPSQASGVWHPHTQQRNGKRVRSTKSRKAKRA